MSGPSTGIDTAYPQKPLLLSPPQPDPGAPQLVLQDTALRAPTFRRSSPSVKAEGGDKHGGREQCWMGRWFQLSPVMGMCCRLGAGHVWSLS